MSKWAFEVSSIHRYWLQAYFFLNFDLLVEFFLACRMIWRHHCWLQALQRSYELGSYFCLQWLICRLYYVDIVGLHLVTSEEETYASLSGRGCAGLEYCSESVVIWYPLQNLRCDVLTHSCFSLPYLEVYLALLLSLHLHAWARVSIFHVGQMKLDLCHHG